MPDPSGQTSGQKLGAAADGVGAGSQAIGSMGIPYVSAIVGAAGGISSMIMKAVAAKKQAEEAAKMRADALRTQKAMLRPEFTNKALIDKMGYLSGLPALTQSQGALDQQTANQMRTIQEYSPNGAATVAAISAALGQQDKATNELGIKNMEYKAGKLKDIGDTSWNIGQEQRLLEQARDAKIREGLIASSAMQNASMANTQNAADTGINAIDTSLMTLMLAQNGNGMKKKTGTGTTFGFGQYGN